MTNIQDVIKGDPFAIEELVDRVFRNGGLISQKKLDYIERESQIDSIKQTMVSLMNQDSILLEGPCGFGKSFVYLFSSIMYSLLRNKRIVIVTDGIALQEQLYYKDAPLMNDIIESTLGSRANIVYLKGRNNFLCNRKVEEVLFSIKSGDNTNNTPENKKIFDWYKQTQLGDISELSYVPNYELWRNYSCVDSGDCQKSSCAYYDKCYYYNLRKKSESSDLIITNYHLLFSDIQTGGKVLPKYNAIVFDEAHEMAKIARDFQEIKVSYNSFMALSRKISAIENKFGDKFKAKETNIQGLVAEAFEYFKDLTSKMDFKKKSMKMLEEKIDHSELSACLDDFISEFEIIKSRYEIDEDEYGIIEREYEDVTNREMKILFYELSSAYEICTTISSVLENVCAQSHPQKYAYYAALENNNLVSLRAKPIRVSDYFYDNFFKDEFGVGKQMIPSIITSATLSTGGNFNFIREEIGLEKSNQIIASSPFDLENQELWYLPHNAIEGNNYDNFQERMIENLEELSQACGGGVLGLFTSINNMEQATWHLRENTRFRILMQGDMPKQKLLEEFKKDKNSILLGTKSMFTGVDIPGDSLRCVFIDKLPFDSPDDPVIKELNKEQNAFFKYSIPSMCMIFKQAVGRGVRSISDRCIIAIADNRLATARYKSSIAKSFPYKKTLTRDIEDVRKFLERK